MNWFRDVTADPGNRSKVSLSRIKMQTAAGGSLPGVLDVTVKSACNYIGQRFAPTWPMVWRYKDGIISQQGYTRLYHELLERRITPMVAKELYRLGVVWGMGVKLACYCGDREFCHTHLAIEWLVQRYPQYFKDGRVEDPYA